MKMKKVFVTQAMTHDYHSKKDQGKDVELWSYKVTKTTNTTEVLIGDLLNKSQIDSLAAREDVTVEIS